MKTTIIYLLVLLLIPATGISQKKEIEKVRTTKEAPVKPGYTEVEWTIISKQITAVKNAITTCEAQKKDCAKTEAFANKIAKQPFKKQIETILSAGNGSNFMTEMAYLEKILMNDKRWSWEKTSSSIIEKAPSYELRFVKSRIRMHEKHMEMVYDDDDDE